MALTARVVAHGPVADEIAWLWWVLLVLGAAVYVLVVGLLVLPAVRRRLADGEGGEEVVARPAVPRAVEKRWIVAGGVLLPSVVLPIALGLSVWTMRDIPQSAPSGSLVVEVVGYQWWWSIEYPDHQVVVANEMHIPVGEPVELRLTSADVIHSLWVPDLAGKVDALPDGTTTLVIEADRPGRYGGRCAEFCGLEHARMQMVVVAEPPDEFASWLEEQERPASPPGGPQAARGEDLFVDNGCGDCHTVRGTTAGTDEAPDLTHFGSRSTLSAVLIPSSTENLAAWIRDPDMVKEETGMPPAELTDEELDSLVAYLEGLE